jgi:hypothetical protein
VDVLEVYWGLEPSQQEKKNSFDNTIMAVFVTYFFLKKMTFDILIVLVLDLLKKTFS